MTFNFVPKVLCCFSCIFFIFTGPAIAQDRVHLQTLKAVQVVFRHGARNIQRTFPSDPYKNESFWPRGFNQLTCIGEVQCYNLGGFLRSRYDGFLSENYVPGELYTKSSDIDRTIQSALSVLAGLYPPNPSLGENNTNCKQIQWKNIPVHTTPERFDPILHQEAPCERYQWLMANSPGSVLSDYKGLFDILTLVANNTGVDASLMDGSTFALLGDYYDAILVEGYFNMTIPDWAQSIVGTPEADLFQTASLTILTSTPELKQMRAGPLVNLLVENFELVLGRLNASSESNWSDDDNSGARNPGRKITLLSGHDKTLASLMNTLGIYWNETQPHFASALILELHQNFPEEQPYIKILFRNDVYNKEPLELKIPDCGDPCYFSQFMKMTETFRLTYDEWDSLCKQIPGETSPLLHGVLWTLGLLSVTLILIGVILFCRSIMRVRGSKKYDRII